ncbi:Calmodulin-dependent protein kinase cmk2, partial [Spiromyces aspiralis]
FGTFGQVRLARFTPTNQEVAVKVIKKEAIKNDANMVLKEIAVVERLDHPNIVRLLDWFESSTKYYLVFEVCTGGELFQKIFERGRFSEKDALPIMRVCFEALAYLHANNIVHRDIKPENLLFKTPDEGSPLMLTDFGISRVMRDDNEILTTMCGSFRYAAPEILIREGYGKSVDIWSMGTVLFSVLCGYSPWWKYDHDQREMLRAMKYMPIEFDERYWWGISEDVKDLIRHCLDPNQHTRITAEEVLRHPWFTSVSVSDRDLLTDVKGNWQKKLQRAFNKIKVINRFRSVSGPTSEGMFTDSEVEDDPQNSASSFGGNAIDYYRQQQQQQQQQHLGDANSTNPFVKLVAQAQTQAQAGSNDGA